MVQKAIQPRKRLADLIVDEGTRTACADDAQLTHEQRIAAIERWIARQAVGMHNNEYTRLGSPPQGVFAPTRVAAVMTSDEHAEMRKLERELAYRTASGDVELLAVGINDGETRPVCRWNVESIHKKALLQSERHELEQAVQYLDWIGCLDRDPAHPHIVKIKELP